jgi:hypothetical protein
MQRYFFNVATPNGMLPDLEGAALPSLDGAVTLAEASMREMIADAFKWNRRAPHAIQIIDENGYVLTEITSRQIAQQVL